MKKPIFNLYDYQQVAVSEAKKAIDNGERLLLTAPTGTGKSYAQLQTHLDHETRGFIVTPSVDIVKGLVQKATGRVTPQYGSWIDDGKRLNIYTPVALRNMLENSGIKPQYILADEAHHASAETWQELFDYGCPVIGYTATPFRGSPQANAEFLALWNRSLVLLSWSDAVKRGKLTFPDVHTVPLVDDDLIEVRNGEFAIATVEDKTRGAFGAIANLFEKFNLIEPFRGRTRFRIATCVTMPSVPTAKDFATFFALKHGLPAEVITAETPQNERDIKLNRVLERRALLVQVRTLGEGSDYPLRCMIDCAPTLSPVKFTQLFGRVCRPCDYEKPLYIATNRNVQTHGYILRDVLPLAAFKEAVEVFGGLTKRATYRSAGIESFGKVKPTEVLLKTGEVVHLYQMQSTDDDGKYQLACVVSPLDAEPFWFYREMPNGRWARCENPKTLDATASVARYVLTVKQAEWWEKQAERYGLDAGQPLDSRKFQILPILYNSGFRLR